MRGKIAVVLANDPDFEAGQDLGFEGRRMAFSGRVGEKFAAAAKAGAAGVLVIHEDAAASYPFLQLASGDALPAMAIAPLQPSATYMLSGWLRNDVAVALLGHAGLDLATLKLRARDPKFRAFALGDGRLTASGSLVATPVISHNVIGKLTGTRAPGQTVLYGAHWDANGQNGPVAGDGIRNGAVDNATGTAEVIEVARAFARGPRPARTVVFAAWTAEEKGLLGSDYYAAHPLFPLATTAAVINLDPHVVLPAARDIELIGGGRVSLEHDLRRIAGTHGLTVVDEPAIEAGWYFRSDQFSFARRGVPAITFRAGRNLVDGATAKGAAIVAEYNARRYHQPSDEFDPSWTFAGTAQEASVACDLGRHVANAATWATWNAGVAYGAMRALTDGERTVQR
jgi:Zn-dependent M28 family amino/carboxypeptidase